MAALAAVPLPILGPEDAERAQEERPAPARTAMEEAAEHLRERVAGRAGVLSAHAAEALKMDRKALQMRLAAVSEQAVAEPPRILADIVRYVDQMKESTLDPVAFVEHQLFDATPSHLRVPDAEAGQEQWRVKLHMIETEYAILFRGKGDEGPFYFIRVPFHGALRLSERGTAENQCRVLQSVAKLPQHLSATFGQRLFRLTESDEDGANWRSEGLLQGSREREWTDSTLHTVCIAHKLHTAAQHTWSFVEHIISGAIHTYKTLNDHNNLSALKVVLRLEIRRRLTVQYVASLDGLLSPGAAAFRNECERLFLPPHTQPRRRALMLQVLEMVNGDIRQRKCLVHYCVPGCCRSREATALKMVKWIPKALVNMRAHCFARNHWLGWASQLDFFGWAWALHGLLHDCLLQTFSGGDRGGAVPENQDGQEAMDAAMAPLQLAGPAPLQDDQPLQPDEAANPMELLRFQKARSLKLATEFLESEWGQDMFILRASLQGEVRLMTSVCTSVSEEAEINRMMGLLGPGNQTSRVQSVVSGELTKPMFDEAMRTVHSEECWSHLPSTEALRAKVWRFCWRPCATVWQLIVQRYSQFPWRLFHLLNHRSEEVARGLLHARPCLRDAFANQFLSLYHSAGLLLGEECHQLLSGFAALLRMCTFTTECHHSGTVRRAKMRAQSKRMDTAQLAHRHASCSTVSWLKRHLLPPARKSSGRKRGRPCSSVREAVRAPVAGERMNEPERGGPDNARADA